MIEKLKIADNSLYKIVKGTIILLFVAVIPVSIFLIADGWEFIIIFGLLLGAAVLSLLIWFDYIIAGYFYFIAVDKAYSETFYLKINYFVPLVGQLLVIAMPDRSSKKAENTYDDEELPDF